MLSINVSLQFIMQILFLGLTLLSMFPGRTPIVPNDGSTGDKPITLIEEGNDCNVKFLISANALNPSICSGM